MLIKLANISAIFYGTDAYIRRIGRSYARDPPVLDMHPCMSGWGFQVAKICFLLGGSVKNRVEKNHDFLFKSDFFFFIYLIFFF